MKYPLASDTWDEKEIAAINDVIRGGRYTMGTKVKEFEKSFAQRFGKKHAIMTNSGSSANLLMIASLVLNPDYDLSAGDEVIVPAVSWSTTFFPLTQHGLIPVFVDIKRTTLNIDETKIIEAISPKTKAIFAVNLLGNSCDYAALRTIANDHKLILIEDNCESLGAMYGDQMLGSIGTMGSFSFFFSHHLQTMEGGMILTDDTKLEQYCRSLRAHGWIRDLPDNNHIHDKTGDPFEDSFKFVLPGYCVRPLEMSGAIGSVQLEKMDRMMAQRRYNAGLMMSLMRDVKDIKLQQEQGNSSWFGFSLLLENSLEGKRSELVRLLAEQGIETRPIVAGNFTKNPVIKHMPHRISGELKEAEYIDANGLFVGNDSKEMPDQISLLVDVLRNFK